MVEIENLIDGKRYRIHGLLSSSVTMAKVTGIYAKATNYATNPNPRFVRFKECILVKLAGQKILFDRITSGWRGYFTFNVDDALHITNIPVNEKWIQEMLEQKILNHEIEAKTMISVQLIHNELYHKEKTHSKNYIEL